MVSELTRHEFWHNQMDGIRPGGHQLQEFGGYPDLFCGDPRLLPGSVAAEKIEEVETIARLPGGLSEQIAIDGRNSW